MVSGSGLEHLKFFIPLKCLKLLTTTSVLRSEEDLEQTDACELEQPSHLFGEVKEASFLEATDRPGSN